jgi:hypothetical protein
MHVSLQKMQDVIGSTLAGDPAQEITGGEPTNEVMSICVPVSTTRTIWYLPCPTPFGVSSIYGKTFKPLTSKP